MIGPWRAEGEMVCFDSSSSAGCMARGLETARNIVYQHNSAIAALRAALSVDPDRLAAAILREMNGDPPVELRTAVRRALAAIGEESR